MILAGDIGGTKTNLALYSLERDRLIQVAEQNFSSRDYRGIDPLLEEFAASHNAELEAICLGVAAPVIGGRAKTTNLPWLLEEDTISRNLRVKQVKLLNDLEAAAYGVLCLGDDDFVILNRGATERDGNRALIAAGTGLGESIMAWDGKNFHPVASEGGHGDYAPRTSREIALLEYLMGRFQHVSYERVLSGPGLLNIYSFLKDSGRYEEPDWLAGRLRVDDPSAEISRVALAGEAEICVEALDVFVSVYGAEAGNMALRGYALGGVYVCGGIAPKILKKLQDGTFMKAFVEKGRYKDFNSTIPVSVVLNEKTALLGAAHYANSFMKSRERS
jgi:glucokinase